MSKIKNGGLDQYGAGPFEPQQFGTADVEGVKQTPETVSTDGRLPDKIRTNNASGVSQQLIAHSADVCRMLYSEMLISIAMDWVTFCNLGYSTRDDRTQMNRARHSVFNAAVIWRIESL